MEVEQKENLKELLETEEGLLASAVRECHRFKKQRETQEAKRKKRSKDELKRETAAIYEAVLKQEGRDFFIGEDGKYIPPSDDLVRSLVLLTKIKGELGIVYPPEDDSEMARCKEYLCSLLMALVSSRAIDLLDRNPEATIEDIIPELKGPNWDDLPLELKDMIYHWLKKSIPEMLHLLRASKAWNLAGEKVVQGVVEDYEVNFLCNLPFALWQYRVFQSVMMQRGRGSRHYRMIWDLLVGKYKKPRMHFCMNADKQSAGYQVSDLEKGRLEGSIISVSATSLIVEEPQAEFEGRGESPDDNLQLRAQIRLARERRRFIELARKMDEAKEYLHGPLPPGIHISDAKSAIFASRCIQLFAKEYPDGFVRAKGLSLYRDGLPNVIHLLDLERENFFFEYEVRNFFPWVRLEDRTELIEGVEYGYPYVSLETLRVWIRKNLNDAARNSWFSGRAFLRVGYRLKDADKVAQLSFPGFF